jgi:CheY-like chemotaxis protein
MNGELTRPLQVLVVDDCADTRDTLRMLLDLWGYAAEGARDGPSALAAATRLPPDVVLLDVGLPGMNGYEVARRLRQAPGLERVRIVALTGYGRQEDITEALRAGCDRHLTKPVEPDVLRAALQAHACHPAPARLATQEAHSAGAAGFTR